MVLVEIKVLWIGASNYQLMQGMYLLKKKKKQLVAFYAWSKKCFLKYFLSPPPKGPFVSDIDLAWDSCVSRHQAF